MFSVALIGPDGAGKTTIGRRLARSLPLRVKYLYMGVNLDASNRMLPTTWLWRKLKRTLGAPPDTAGPPDPSRAKPQPKGAVKRAAAALKSLLSVLNRMGEEWYRQGLAWYYERRGHIVIFDRHYFHDFYAYDVAAPAAGRQPLAGRIHGYMLSRLYPQPDLVIYLDAPGEVLFARKGEGTVEALERRRQDYMEVGRLARHFAVVDASRPEDEVAQQAERCILEYYESHAGRAAEVRS